MVREHVTGDPSAFDAFLTLSSPGSGRFRLTPNARSLAHQSAGLLPSLGGQFTEVVKGSNMLPPRSNPAYRPSRPLLVLLDLNFQDSTQAEIVAASEDGIVGVARMNWKTSVVCVGPSRETEESRRQ